jgi:predicted extracellular nuclease
MPPLHRLFFVLVSTLFLQITARAQISYTGGNYTQNFDTLPSAGTFTLSGAGPFALDSAPVSASGLGGWNFAKVNGTGANALFNVGTGSSTTGSVYSFGLAGSGERALGTLLSGTVGSAIGATLVNNTGATITQFTLSYTGEQWRYGGTSGVDRLIFDYQVGGTNITTGTFTVFPDLDFVSPVNTSTGGVTGLLNGNDAANHRIITATVSGLNWAAGQTLVLRWTDFNVTGSDDGLAIDDFTFSTSGGSGPVMPAVTGTTPADAAVNISPGTNPTVTFNSNVTANSSSFTITGSTSGAHTTTVMGGPTTFTLVPAPTFDEGETVTVTVLAGQVTDAATGTLHPNADTVFSFTTLTSAPLPIHTVQGSGLVSPYVGQSVAIDGVVTATFQGTNALSGFYVQAPEADYDSNPDTSEGIFVFNNSFTVNTGDLVRVTGTVAEFGTAPSTQTELTNVTNVIKLGVAPLPTPVEISLPFASTTYAERYEGMRVTLLQTLTVTDNFDLGHFGEIILSNGRLSTPTNIVAPGAAATAQSAANFLNQILVDDGTSVTYPDPTPFLEDSAGHGPTRRAGSTATGTTGIFDEKFGSYIIEPTAPLTFADANPRSNPPVIGGTLHVAIGNVLNFFNGDGAGGGFPTSRGANTFAEYERQRAKIIAGITALAPDIMGLTEVENDRITNGAADSYGPTSAIADLVNGINAAAPAGTTYAFVNAAAVDIVTDEIHCAFIYQVGKVEPVGLPAMLNDPAFNNLARNPLAQTFREISSGEKLTVSINHFKSKSSASTGTAATDGITPNPNFDQGDGQGQSNYIRKKQALALIQWLATDPTNSGDPDFLIIGDLNSYAKEDPIAAIENADFVNLTEAAEGPGGYSYAFNAEFGHLDHALANNHLAGQVVSAATWHVNSDEPVYYDYNVENKDAAQQTINTGTAYRYSDHDPVVVGFNLHPDASAPSFTTQPASQTVTAGGSVTFTVAVAGYPAPGIQWQKDGADLPGATGNTLTLNSVTSASAGSYTAIATNSVGTAVSTAATLVVEPATASLSLSNLAYTYDSTPKSATVTTNPVGLNVTVTYDGNVAAPVNAGSYAVVATINDSNYVGTANGTLTIAKAAATVTLGNLTQVYDGTPKSATATTTPLGLSVGVTYNGNATPPTAAGSYSVAAIITDPNYTGSDAATLTVQTAPPPVTSRVVVRHAPTMNASIDGSLQVLLGENIVFNGGASLSGDLFVPGTPGIRLNGNAHYSGTVNGTGSAAPTGYTVTLNGNISLQHIVAHTDPLALPTVAAPPQPTGTRSVSLNNASQNPGDFATLRNLTLNSNVGQVVVPPGTYGNFTANSNGGFTLGLAGSTTPAVYNLQNLTLNSNTSLQVVGPVILIVNGGFSINGSLGSAAHPEWLQLRIAGGGLSLNSNATVNGYVQAPAGTVTLNSNSRLIGGLTCDRLTLNSNAVVRPIGVPPGF